MKIQKILFAVVVACFVLTSCKTEEKKEAVKVVAKDAKVEQFTMNISGMTCEMGCANKIRKDLRGKDGVLEANVIFKDSIATVKYDANVTNKKELMSFVDGIAGGDFYKASEAEIRPPNCKCEGCKGKTECSESCKNECNKTKEEKA